MLAFSFTVPLTRIAVTDLDPVFVGTARAVVAGALALTLLALARARRPAGRQWVRLAVVAGGVVVGFPVLTSLALTTTTAAPHAAVVIGLLPAATAVAAVLRTGERPPTRFWVFATVGAVAVAVFSTLGRESFGTRRRETCCCWARSSRVPWDTPRAGVLARDLGAWQTISWALVVALPVTVAATAVLVTPSTPSAGGTQGRRSPTCPR